MFECKIETGNAAMDSLEAVADALRDVADELQRGEGNGAISDANGNACGEYLYVEEAPEPTPVERHLAELHEMGYGEDSLAPLLDLEARAHKNAEDLCNVEGATDEREDIADAVADLFNGEEPEGFFVNGDPRGYALKLRDGTGSLTYRDWGGFEILAPDFN